MRANRFAFAFLAVLLLLLIVVAALATGPIVRRKRMAGGAEKRPLTIQWDGPEACYPRPMVAECLKAARAVAGFGPAGQEGRNALAAAAQNLSAKYRIPIGVEQLEAVRTQEVALAARTSGVQAQRVGDVVAQRHAAGETVLALAARYHLPPLAVLRQILVEGGHSATAIRAMLSSPERLPPRLAAEFEAVQAADLGSRPNAARIRAQSQVYEDAVAAYLRRRGLSFKTEDELRAAHAAQSPQSALQPPLVTPDFLLAEPILINGRRVAWLDAKDYPAFDGKLVMKGLARQAAKYTARFGPGAFVFSGGVMCGSDISRLGVLVLDGSHLRARPTEQSPAEAQGTN